MDWQSLRMHWATFTFRERVRIVGAAAVLLAILCVAVRFFAQIRSANFGFGPDWDCVGFIKGGPFCVKHNK